MVFFYTFGWLHTPPPVSPHCVKRKEERGKDSPAISERFKANKKDIRGNKNRQNGAAMKYFLIYETLCAFLALLLFSSQLLMLRIAVAGNL